jgi:hypothetical protein
MTLHSTSSFSYFFFIDQDILFRLWIVKRYTSHEGNVQDMPLFRIVILPKCQPLSLFTLPRGSVMARAVSRRTFSSRPGFEYRPVHPRGICGEQNGTNTVFSWNNSGFHCQYHNTNVFYRRYILSIWQRRELMLLKKSVQRFHSLSLPLLLFTLSREYRFAPAIVNAIGIGRRPCPSNWWTAASNLPCHKLRCEH